MQPPTRLGLQQGAWGKCNRLDFLAIRCHVNKRCAGPAPFMGRAVNLTTVPASLDRPSREFALAVFVARAQREERSENLPLTLRKGGMRPFHSSGGADRHRSGGKEASKRVSMSWPCQHGCAMVYLSKVGRSKPSPWVPRR